jgi:hypothetical protein
MRYAALLGLLALLGATAVAAGPATDAEGPLSPCVPAQAESNAASSDQPSAAWGVEIASAFSRDEALAEFDRAKQDHSDILGSYAPMLVATCDLHFGTTLRYSARIGMQSRDDADKLCAKLQAAGGACIVQKN